jgi:hypothetical protein
MGATSGAGIAYHRSSLMKQYLLKDDLLMPFKNLVLSMYQKLCLYVYSYSRVCVL